MLASGLVFGAACLRIRRRLIGEAWASSLRKRDEILRTTEDDQPSGRGSITCVRAPAWRAAACGARRAPRSRRVLHDEAVGPARTGEPAATKVRGHREIPGDQGIAAPIRRHGQPGVVVPLPGPPRPQVRPRGRELRHVDVVGLIAPQDRAPERDRVQDGPRQDDVARAVRRDPRGLLPSDPPPPKRFDQRCAPLGEYLARNMSPPPRSGSRPPPKSTAPVKLPVTITLPLPSSATLVAPSSLVPPKLLDHRGAPSGEYSAR